MPQHRGRAPLEEGQIIADLAGGEAFEGYHQRPDADALRDNWHFTGDTCTRSAALGLRMRQ